MIALPNISESSMGTKLSIEKVSSEPFDLAAALEVLSQKRLIQLDPPVTTLNKNAWASIIKALFEKRCDLIAGIYYGRFGMVERLLSSDPREESEESLRYAEIRYLILPGEPTPQWVFAFGYPVEL